MVKGLRKTGDLLARSDLCPPTPWARGGGVLRDRRTAAGAGAGRRARGPVRVEPARVGRSPVAVGSQQRPSAAKGLMHTPAGVGENR